MRDLMHTHPAMVRESRGARSVRDHRIHPDVLQRPAHRILARAAAERARRWERAVARTGSSSLSVGPPRFCRDRRSMAQRCVEGRAKGYSTHRARRSAWSWKRHRIDGITHDRQMRAPAPARMAPQVWGAFGGVGIARRAWPDRTSRDAWTCACRIGMLYPIPPWNNFPREGYRRDGGWRGPPPCAGPAYVGRCGRRAAVDWGEVSCAAELAAARLTGWTGGGVATGLDHRALASAPPILAGRCCGLDVSA
jgi:hypothetical protein